MARPKSTVLGILIVLLLSSTLVSCHQDAQVPVTLNYLGTGLIRPSDLPAAEALSRKFLSQTGLGLRHLHGVEEDTLDQLTLTRKLLEDRSEGPDVLAIDVTWLGVLRDDLIDLKPYLPAETSAIGPGLASSYVVDGKVVAIPLHINGGILAYRADLLRNMVIFIPRGPGMSLKRWRCESSKANEPKAKRTSGATYFRELPLNR